MVSLARDGLATVVDGSRHMPFVVTFCAFKMHRASGRGVYWLVYYFYTKIAILKISVGIARAGRKRGNRRTDKLTLAAHARLNEINDQPYTTIYTTILVDAFLASGIERAHNDSSARAILQL